MRTCDRMDQFGGADLPKIAINGLGRIGRSILRLLTTTRAGEGFEIVALNDIARPELCAYLLKHDSVFGPFPGTVTHDDTSLTINGTRYPLTAHPDLSESDLSGVDLVLECTGKSNSRAFAERGLRAGALPDMAGRIFATSVRVPTASVSAIDMSFQAQAPLAEEKINAALRAAAGPILGLTDEPLVSSDLRGRPESIVMALPETHVTASGGMARVFGWYDNEWGFSNRMIDLAGQMTSM